MSQIHPQIQAILDRARQRAADNNLPYAGALTPPEAQQVLLGMPEAKLVDVRTQAEWQFVGTVPNAVQLEWKRFPGMTPNPEFIGQLQSVADPDATLLFMCRSGARSHDAATAAAAEGYAESYNVLEGFEGDKDASQHRGSVNGWQGHRLPWVQS